MSTLRVWWLAAIMLLTACEVPERPSNTNRFRLVTVDSSGRVYRDTVDGRCWARMDEAAFGPIPCGN